MNFKKKSKNNNLKRFYTIKINANVETWFVYFNLPKTMSRLNPFKMPVQNRFAALSENYDYEHKQEEKQKIQEQKKEEIPAPLPREENVFKKPLVMSQQPFYESQQPRLSYQEQRIIHQKQAHEQRVNLFLQQKREDAIKNQPKTEDTIDIQAEQDFPTLFEPKQEKKETKISFTEKLKEALARKEVVEVTKKKSFEDEVSVPISERKVTPLDTLDKLCELYVWQEKWGRFWYGNEAYNEMYGIENKRSYEYILRRLREKEVILPDESEPSDIEEDYDDDMDTEEL